MERRSSTTQWGTRDAALWEQDPELRGLLEESDNLETAREAALTYLNEQERSLHDGVEGLDRLQLATALGAIRVLKGMLSLENEALAGLSTLDSLRRVACGWGEDEIGPGFIEEFHHLFRRMHGNPRVGRARLSRRRTGGGSARDSAPETGLRASVARSAFLDELAAGAVGAMGRYPSGLDEDLVGRRLQNRRTILTHLGGSARDWSDPEWQMAHVLKGESGLAMLRRLVPLSGEELAAIHLSVRHHLPWGITPYYLSLFDFRSDRRTEDGQVRSQVIPPLHTVRAMVEHRSDRADAFDFMREHDTSPAKHITRRYPMVAILKVCDTCPQICAYCQRNWEISDAMAVERIPRREELERALEWFKAHERVEDVLLTGGDPLVLGDDLVTFLLDRLAGMEHVKHIRIGTRVPVTVPMRITDELAGLLAGFVEPGRRQVSVMTHVESVYEITPELAEACGKLKNHGVGVYNQQVFTLETSRRFQTAANRVALKRVGIDPYYTFYTKGKDEHRDYLVPLARLLQERKEEARLLPGTFRTDESVFNVPGLGKHHLRAHQDREWIAVRPDGRRVYLFHPWEKGIAAAAPWEYVDTGILEYLERLQQLGEDPADYETIWDYD